jgi:hypothetical protein
MEAAQCSDPQVGALDHSRCPAARRHRVVPSPRPQQVCLATSLHARPTERQPPHQVGVSLTLRPGSSPLFLPQTECEQYMGTIQIVSCTRTNITEVKYDANTSMSLGGLIFKRNSCGHRPMYCKPTDMHGSNQSDGVGSRYTRCSVAGTHIPRSEVRGGQHPPPSPERTASPISNRTTPAEVHTAVHMRWSDQRL